MAATPPVSARRRRRGSVERPINERTYRGTWLLVAIPLLVAAFSVGRPQALPRGILPASFDGAAATRVAGELTRLHPDRRPGTAGGARAAEWFLEQLRRQGLRPARDRFSARVPALGERRLENISASIPGRTPATVVVMAHRDNIGAGPGANDNASGTAALVELARAYAGADSATPPAARAPAAHTIVFLSTDGGAFGGLGAERFLARVEPTRLAAVVNLDTIAGAAPPAVRFAGDRPRSPPASLVATASARLLEQSGVPPRRPSALRQLVDLAFPFSVYEHAQFVGAGVPALTVTTAGDRPPSPLTDTPDRLEPRRLGQVGRTAELLLGSLEQGFEVGDEEGSYVYLGSRVVRGWAIQLVLIAALLPFFVAAVDLFARCRRRGIALAPAFRSYRRRLGFLALLSAVFASFALLGVWREQADRPLPPDAPGAGDWPAVPVLALAAIAVVGWFVARARLLPRRPVGGDEELAGHTAALLVLGVVALVVAAVNPFALVFVLPSLHAWLWLPQLRDRPAWRRLAVLAAGFAGPALLLAAFASRLDLGLDAPWYLAQLAAHGDVSLPLLACFVAWLAASGQLAALAVGRYAPYPGPRERAPRGPLRDGLRRLEMGRRRRNAARTAAPEPFTEALAGDTAPASRPGARSRHAQRE